MLKVWLIACSEIKAEIALLLQLETRANKTNDKQALEHGVIDTSPKEGIDYSTHRVQKWMKQADKLVKNKS